MRSKDAQFNSKDCKITEIGCAISLVKNLWFIIPVNPPSARHL